MKLVDPLIRACYIRRLKFGAYSYSGCWVIRVAMVVMILFCTLLISKLHFTGGLLVRTTRTRSQIVLHYLQFTKNRTKNKKLIDVFDLGGVKWPHSVRFNSIWQGFCDWFYYDWMGPLLATRIKIFSKSKWYPTKSNGLKWPHSVRFNSIWRGFCDWFYYDWMGHFLPLESKTFRNRNGTPL